jgi:NAD(P)H-hydrate epimerase
MRIVTAAEIQKMDRQTIEAFGIPGRILMESAGRGATRCFLERVYDREGSVGVIAGRGNNGGDGFVMARYLAQRGIEVAVFLLATRDRVGGDAESNLRLIEQMEISIVEIPDAKQLVEQQPRMRRMHYWIDAIFGTGLNADVRGHYREAIELINSLERPVYAVDIPSGLNADTGRRCGTAVRAAATATFGFAKIGHLVQSGIDHCGDVDIIDIGIPSTVAETIPTGQRLVTGHAVKQMIPRRRPDSHKGDTGHALVVAASPGKTGAAAMAATAALRVGAGLVTLAVPRSLNPQLETLAVEAMTLPLPGSADGVLTEDAFDAIVEAAREKRCIAIGPGIGTDPRTRSLVHRLVAAIDLPMVIDADGLNSLVGHLDLFKQRKAPTVITPHPGEMARLMACTPKEVQSDRITAAREFARRHQIHVVLKGARTVIADPAGSVWINPTGNPGMASGGMGDVLTGAVAGLLAQGCPPPEASIAAAYLHGLAADLLAADTPRGFLATEVMDSLPRAVQSTLSDPLPPILNGPWL